MAPLVSGEVMHRGTYNGNPLSTAAAVACVDYLASTRREVLSAHGALRGDDRRARTDVRHAARASPSRRTAWARASSFSRGVESVPTLRDLAQDDKERTLAFTEAMVMQGVAPLPRGLMYVSAAHTEADIERTLIALTTAIASLV